MPSVVLWSGRDLQLVDLGLAEICSVIHKIRDVLGCLVQVGNGIELEAVGLQI